MFNWVKSFLIKVLRSFWHCWEGFCEDFVVASLLSPAISYFKIPMKSNVKTSISCWNHASDRCDPKMILQENFRNLINQMLWKHHNRRTVSKENKIRLSFSVDHFYDCLQKSTKPIFFTFHAIKSNHRCNALGVLRLTRFYQLYCLRRQNL